MGFLDNVKAFVHSLTTEDHYASYDSPYRSSAMSGNASNESGGRLSEFNRLASINSSSQSLDGGDRNTSSTNVGYRPGMRSSNLNSSSEVPLQTFDNTGQPPLPSIDAIWDRIESWLEENYPELEDNLNSGVTTADLNEFENDLGSGSLPTEFRQFYKRHDGQLNGGNPTGLVYGLELLDLESISEEYALWAKVASRLEKQEYLLNKQQPKEGSSSSEHQSKAQTVNSFIKNQRSVPPNSVQSVYVHRGWIPIIRDNIGNVIALDVAPGPTGKWGQIIIFGREYDTKLVVADSFHEFIFGLLSDFENGNFEIERSNSRDAYGYLESSRDDDYMIGAEDDGEGDLTFFDRDNREFPKTIDTRKLSYLEVLKLRALRKYGLSDSYSTSFVPQRIRTKLTAPSNSSLRSSSPVLKTSNKNASANPLIKLESAADVTLPKETLIDEEKPKGTKDDKIRSSETKNEDKEAINKKSEEATTEKSEATASSNAQNVKKEAVADQPIDLDDKKEDVEVLTQDKESKQKSVDGMKDVEL